MPWFAVLAICFLATSGSFARAQTVCQCDPQKPETMEARQCSLCRVAEAQAPNVKVFLVADTNPKKANRTLAMPRAHVGGMHRMADLDPETRLALWDLAISTAKQKWGERWAIAYNGDNVRTQCHVHVHIGKLIDGVEAGDFLVADDVKSIPVPGVDGFWIHPVGGKLHVHTGEQITETVLLR